jgi:carbamate kinase
LLAFHNGVNAIATVVGTASFGLNANVKVSALQVPIQLWPDGRDVVVITGGFGPALGLLVNQTRTRCVSHNKTSLSIKRLLSQELF